MPNVRVNGVDMHYREAGDGFPIVLIHGFTGNVRNWALQIPALTREFRTISLDVRGHGHSGKPSRREDYTLDVMADDVYGLVQQLGLEQCYLMGHSMGGMIAQHLVLAHPEPFPALVLVDTAAEEPEGMRSQERARLAEIAREQGMEAVFEEQYRADLMAEQLRGQPEAIESWRQQFLLTSLEAYLYCAEAIANREPLLDELRRIGVPTLIVCGEKDTPFVGPSRRMHERIPGSELAIIEDSGHTPQIEKPAEFNRILADFLSRVHQSVVAGGKRVRRV